MSAPCKTATAPPPSRAAPRSPSTPTHGSRCDCALTRSGRWISRRRTSSEVNDVRRDFLRKPVECRRRDELLRIGRKRCEERVAACGIEFAENVIEQEQRRGGEMF